jgi:TRAP-type C4-dicarboxylate transport system substrate-binding protein
MSDGYIDTGVHGMTGASEANTFTKRRAIMMKARKKQWARHLMFLAVVTAAMIITLNTVAAASDAPVYKARYSYHWFPTHHLAVYSEKFAKLCGEETKGRLEVTTYPSGQLYSARNAIAAVSQGSVEMAGCIALTLASAAPEFGADTLMLLFDDYDQQRKVWGTKPGKAVIEGLEQKLGVKLLCRLPNGPACLFTTDKKVQDIEGFKGLKARLLSASEKPYWEALGASTVSMGTEQVYTALQQGMIDAVWTVPSAIKAYSWWDVAKFCTLPYTAYPDSLLVVNAKWWDSLPQDIKDILLKRVVPTIEKESTNFVMDDAKANLGEFAKQKGGEVVTLSPQDVKTLKKMCVEKVYPPLVTKYNPAFWNAIVEQQGLKK